MPSSFPEARTLLANRGYEAGWIGDAWTDQGIVRCILSKTRHKVPIPHDSVLYRQRHMFEDAFGRL